MVVYFAAIARNIGDKLMAFQLYMGEVLEEFPDARVFVYENNSKDNTKYLLDMWAAFNNKVTVKCEDVDQEILLKNSPARTMYNEPCRMENIAYARNRLMEMLEETDIGTREEDRIVMIDCDFPCLFSPESLIRCLKEAKDYDALFANGKSARGKYYDLSAYYELGSYPFGLELLSESVVFNEKYKERMVDIPSTMPRIPVLSAFGGIGIYRASAIRGLRYAGHVTQDVHKVFSEVCLQHPTHPWVKKVKEKPVTHLEGALQGVYLFDKELFYKNNSGYNYPVICEHVPFHCAMINRGASRLFVEPSLLYISDH